MPDATAATAALTTARELAARLVVLERYDSNRRALGHDYGCGQRAHELNRLRHELETAVRSANLWRTFGAPTLTTSDLLEAVDRSELRQAYQQHLTPRLERRSSTPAQASRMVAAARGTATDLALI
jgi:hypothetical protein